MIKIKEIKDKNVEILGMGGQGIENEKEIVEGGERIIEWEDNKESVEREKSDGIEKGDMRKEEW